ncbi:MAG: hypothetical protein KUL82_13055 [Bdellovibrio sp.]|nr:hypothetical protein [Bdellovibrio sp.]
MSKSLKVSIFALMNLLASFAVAGTNTPNISVVCRATEQSRQAHEELDLESLTIRLGATFGASSPVVLLTRSVQGMETDIVSLDSVEIQKNHDSSLKALVMKSREGRNETTFVFDAQSSSLKMESLYSGSSEPLVLSCMRSQ